MLDILVSSRCELSQSWTCFKIAQQHTGDTPASVLVISAEVIPNDPDPLVEAVADRHLVGFQLRQRRNVWDQLGSCGNMFGSKDAR